MERNSSVNLSANDNQSSHGGSSLGSGAGSSLVQVGTNARDDMDNGRGANFWNSVFGALYTVNKDRETSPVFFAFKSFMEFMQLFVLMLGVQYGWQFDTNLKAWRFVEFIQVRPFMTEIGHGLFLVLFITFIVLLLACLGIYAWIFYSFQSSKFEYVWPLRMARLFGAIFFETMDIMVMALLMTAMDCRYYGWPKSTRMYNNEFPKLQCGTSPGVIFYIMGLLAMIVFVTLAGFTKLAQMDLNPATRSLDAYAHPAIELWVFGLKVLMVTAGIFLGDYRHLAIVWFVCCIVLCYFFWKWEPMVVPWVNYMRMGTFSAIAYVSCLFMALQFPPDAIRLDLKRSASAVSYKAYAKHLEAALIVVLPAFALGAAASYLRLRYFRITVVNLFKSACSSAKERSIYKFKSPREVEIVSRCCREWEDCDTLKPEAVALAERVVKAGLACLPSSPFMVIWYTAYLVDVQGSYQSGFLQLQVALKLDPAFIDRYAIFSREQAHATKSANGGQGQNDALLDVEFQKSYRVAMFAHKEALAAIRAFWQLLLHAKVQFEDLTAATQNIDHVVKRAEKTYRSVLQRHADQPRLLRLYAKFLERVKHDAWAASKWNMEAEKLEALKTEGRQTNVLGLDVDGGEVGNGRISLFSVGDDGQERALCVFNPQGIMTMTNEAMRDIFGYAKAELKGKSVSVLLPPAFAEQSIQQVKSFVISGRGAVVMRTCEVVAVRKDRSMFGARITVVRIAGIGEDSTFLAAFEAMPIEATTATVWLLASGQVLSVDAQFRDWFGFRPSDLEGGATSAWTPSSKQLDDVLRAARHSMVLASQAAMIAAAQDSADEDVDDPAVQLLARGKSIATADRLDSVAQALSSAAALEAAPATTSEWVLKGVRVMHKFCDPVEVEIKVTNSRPSAFCMHILTVRRTGAAAAKPLPHMVVTTPQGPVLHVTEAFAALLGTTPKALIANGSPTAMEALMVAPFSLMHRAGLSGSMPAQQPPSYSCRSGLSVLMPVVGSASPEALPFKMQMKKRANLDEVHYVCTLEPTSWKQALDERSLRLVVDEAGVVMEVGPSPSSLFGFNPAVLVGHNVSCCVAALRAESDLSSTPESGGVASLLMELALRTQQTAAGMCWRVGVAVAREEVSEASILLIAGAAPGAKAPLQATKMLPAVMSVVTTSRPGSLPVLNSAEELADLPAPLPAVAAPPPAPDSGVSSDKAPVTYELRLWRADMVTSVLEVDSNGVVVETEQYLDQLYPAGAALGVCGAYMLGHHVRDFLPLGDRKFDDLSDDTAFPTVPSRGGQCMDPKKKSNMRTARASTDRVRVGPQVLLHGRHRLDGADLHLSVQLVRKGGGGGAYLVIHPFHPQPGTLDCLSDRLMGQDRLYDVELPTNVLSMPLPRRASGTDSIRGRPSAQGAPVVPSSSSSKLLPAASGSLVLLTHQQNSPRQSNLARDALQRRSSMTAFAKESIGEEPSAQLLSLLEASASERPASRVASFAQPGITVKSISRNGSVAGSVREWVMADGTAPASAMPQSPQRGPAELLPSELAGLDEEDDDGSGEEFRVHASGLSDDGMHSAPYDDGMTLADIVEEDSARENSLGAVGGRRGDRRARNGRKHSKHNSGHDSDGSLLDEAENAADTDADYRRGQRVKKLGKILNAEPVASNARSLKWYTLAITFVLAITSVGVYTLYTFLLNRQVQSVQGLYVMGMGARKLMRVVVTLMDIAMLYQPYPNLFVAPGVIGMRGTKADLAAKKATLSVSLAYVTDATMGAFAGFNGITRRMPEAYGLRELWERPILNENVFVSIPSTENNTDVYTALSPGAGYTLQTFTRQVSLFDGMNHLASNVRDILGNADWYNNTACTARKIRWVDWPSVMYVRINTITYLAGWLQTLDGYAQVVIEAAHRLNTVQVIVLLAQGVLLSVLAELFMWYLCNKVDKNRHRIYSVFVAVPMAMVRVLASQNISLDEADGSEDEMDDGGGNIKGAGGSSAAGLTEVDATGPKWTGAGSSSGKGVHINISGATPAEAAAASGKFAPPPPPRRMGERVVAALCFWRPSKVAPASLRRTLSRSPSGVLWLTWPFFVWGVGILILNIIGHSQLQHVTGPVMTFNTVNFFLCRFWLVLYNIGEIQFNKDPAASAATMTVHLAAAQLEYRALLYGGKDLPDQTSPHFEMITEGIALQAGVGQQMLYLTNKCLAAVATNCLLPTDVFYPYTVHGLDAVARHFFDVMANLIQIMEGGALPTNQGPELQFLFKVREIFSGGSLLVASDYAESVQAVYKSTLLLQTVALVWTLVVMLLYLLFILRPYLIEVSTETRRITELLAQLPVDIDVEGLVQRVLQANGGGKRRPAASFHAAVAPLPQSSSLFPAASQDSFATRGLLGNPNGKAAAANGATSSSLRHSNIQSLAVQDSAFKASLTDRAGSSSSLIAPFLRDVGGSSGRQLAAKGM